jgi:hypothetical protein
VGTRSRVKWAHGVELSGHTHLVVARGISDGRRSQEDILPNAPATTACDLSGDIERALTGCFTSMLAEEPPA